MKPRISGVYSLLIKAVKSLTSQRHCNSKINELIRITLIFDTKK